jgi:predicted unusual protein kinase regulating ubiquinone biosynthesis (AarF/ABC1/UbiB family)
MVNGSSYRVTLNYNEKMESEEEQNISLKACHQRCADRTLKVLEKNGSIFIKLGQHLVSLMAEENATVLIIIECNELSPST